PDQCNTHPAETAPYTEDKTSHGEAHVPASRDAIADPCREANARPDQASAPVGGGADPDRGRARALCPGRPRAGDPRHPDRCVRAAAREPLAAEEVRGAEATLPQDISSDRVAPGARPTPATPLAARILKIPRIWEARYHPPRGRMICPTRRRGMALNVRRVITGHDANGRAMVKIDEVCKHAASGRPGATAVNIWTTEGFPANNDGSADEGLRKVGTTLAK